MAKIKLSRPHNGKETGETIEVDNEQVDYFERIGLSVKEEKQPYVNKKKKQTNNTK